MVAPHPILSWLRVWPVRQSAQVLFAEALSQSLRAGLEISEAIVLAARVNPSLRFRTALREMAGHARAGYSLEAALARTGVRGCEGLLAALQVGEEQGDLAGELAAFARRLDPRADDRLSRAAGRSPEAVRFAAALARLLRDRSLTLRVVEDAGRLAAAGRRSFQAAVAGLVSDMRGGMPFAEALGQRHDYFDPLFCQFVHAAEGRDQLRAVLERLGRQPAGA